MKKIIVFLSLIFCFSCGYIIFVNNQPENTDSMHLKLPAKENKKISDFKNTSLNLKKKKQLQKQEAEKTVSLKDFGVDVREISKLLLKENSAEKIIKFYTDNNLDLNISLRDSDQFPVFHFLAVTNFKEAVNLYNSGLVDVNKAPHLVAATLSNEDPELIKFLLQINCPIQETEAALPLFATAVMADNTQICEMLLERGVDPFKEFNGKNALDWFVAKNKYKNSDTIKYLDELGFQLKESHAILSVQNGSTENVKYIIEKNPSILFSLKNETDLLNIAVSGRCGPDMIKFLTGKGLVIETKHLRAAEKRMQIINEKVAKGRVNPNYIDAEVKDASDVLKYISEHLKK